MVAKFCDMIHPDASSGPRMAVAVAVAVANVTVRSLCNIGPDKKLKAMLI